MKTLLLMRHAKSSWKEPGQADYERPLNERGLHDAPRMGDWIRHHGLVPHQILSSSARRARQTAELVAPACGYAGPIDYRDELYLASAETHVRLLRELPDDAACERVLVVAHNPGLEELLARLTGEEEELPTAAVARIELTIAAWRELSSSERGQLRALWRPKHL